MSTDNDIRRLRSGSEQETAAFGKRLAERIIAAGSATVAGETPSTGWLILLTGTLGSGKTRFVQGFVEALCVQQEVISPTFVLMVPYKGRGIQVNHLDLYRVDSADEVADLALDELLDERQILLIEWGEKFQDYLPPADLAIEFSVLGEQLRELEFRGGSAKGRSVLPL